MGIDVGRGGNVAMSKPSLNVLDISPCAVEYGRHAMTKIVKPNIRQTALFDHSSKVHGNCVRRERSAVCRYADNSDTGGRKEHWQSIRKNPLM